MTDASTKILELIENVDVNDTNVADMLDEIDARFWCWFNYLEFGYLGDTKNEHSVFVVGFQLVDSIEYNQGQEHRDWCAKYTRSLDASESILPPRWDSTVKAYYSTIRKPEGVEYKGYATKPDFSRYHPHDSSRWITRLETNKHLPTKPLAKFHAIIQAIAYERKVKGEA